MFESKIKIVSIGYVASDKPRDTHELQVVPVEITPQLDGELANVTTEMDVEGQDKYEEKYTVQVTASSTVTATWLPIGSNRVTSPDMKRREKVLLWQYADSDKYYWTPMGLDDDLRRLETVVYAWSATDDIDEELDITSNMYTLEISTHNGHITLHTTQANDEPFEYTIQLNTRDGNFFFTDNIGNTVKIDSEERQIRAINADDSEVNIEKTKIYAYAQEEIEVKCDGQLIGYVKDLVDITCDGPFKARAPTMQFGQDDAVQPSVLGDNHAKGHEDMEDWVNDTLQVIGNLGAPTSVPSAVQRMDIASLKNGGDSYSKVNTNQ